LINRLRPEDVWHPKRGAPRGNRNARKHGAYDLEKVALHAACQKLCRSARALINFGGCTAPHQ
jgi:hypothetical protein